MVKLIVGVNDLVTTNPELVKEWDYEKNNKLLPTQVTCGSGKKVWWRCQNQHEWNAQICSRAQGSGCPFCSGRFAIAGVNDLESIHPDVAKEWNYSKNGNVIPKMVAKSSGKKYWWKCSEGHEWQATVSSRTGKIHAGCPFCGGYKCVEGINDLVTKFPDIADEWNGELNADITPNLVSYGSGKRYWWTCVKGHTYQASPSERTGSKQLGCPYCSGKSVLEGYNDLTTTHPLLAEEWDYDRNGDALPTSYSKGSGVVVWWRCEQGHHYEMSIVARTRGSNCPVCSGKRVLVGENDFATWCKRNGFEELLAEWNYEKNVQCMPQSITKGSHTLVWWRGKCGHEWESTIPNRINGNGCPICANQKVMVGYNDLQTLCPELAKEWHPTKNGLLNPSDVVPGSNKVVWWMLPYYDERTKKTFHFEWKAQIQSRAVYNSGCPYLSGQKIQKGFNDLQTINPILASEWNYEKNGLTPDEVGNSNKKVWWKCSFGHEWEAKIASRIRGTGCPICSREQQTSFPEQAIFYYIKKVFPDAINGDRHLGIELDVYIPSKSFAIEYDGEVFHRDVKKDIKKEKICLENDISLVRVREKKCPEIQSAFPIYTYQYGKNDELSSIINEIIMKIADMKFDVDVNRDRMSIVSQYVYETKQNSVSINAPELAKEWHPTLNGSIQPDMVSRASSKKVWWLCPLGHAYESTISHRNEGNGCPYCSGRQVLNGFNDLATVNPQLALEWDYEKNKPLTPNMVTKGYYQKVWWRCKVGHEWEALVSSRSKGNGCPVCSNKTILSGYNDLASQRPDIVMEWNASRNKIHPSEVSIFSHQKVWWKCSLGHEYESSVADKSIGNGCPYCSGKKVLAGFNDLDTLCPNVAREWDYSKNGKIKPNMVTKSSNQSFWWVCAQGHSWKATVNNRTAKNACGCPICGGKKILQGYNDLATTHPQLALEWDYEKNYPITPQMVTKGNNQSFWWKCSLGHEWRTSVNSRTGVKPTGCPICKGRKILQGYNDLATTHPLIASEWNYEHNGELTPEMVSRGSQKKVWWKCRRGHEWEAVIQNRTSRDSRCPYCKSEI